ncbi:hypothetical protein ACFLS1_09315, partial [Verrucomicrobiota bacterium]
MKILPNSKGPLMCIRSGLKTWRMFYLTLLSVFFIQALNIKGVEVNSGFEYIDNRSLSFHGSIFNVDALIRAINDMAKTWPERFKDKNALIEKAESYRALTKTRVNDYGKLKEILAFQRQVLICRNPLLDFDKLLFVRRHNRTFKDSIPSSFHGNAEISLTGHDNDLAVMSIRNPGSVTSIHRPAAGAFIGDCDLHFDADKILFSSTDTNGIWQIFEINVNGKGLRQVTRTESEGIHNYDACYLPDGDIIFSSTAPMVAIPCIQGQSPVATLFRIKPDGSGMRQLCFDQDHNWNPQMMADGRVLYARWEYVDLPHAFSRILFTMNPDGTSQRAIYGSNSFWPNSIFYARQVPGSPSKIVAVISGHHKDRRKGDLILFDTSKGYMEADGVVQSIPGYGKKVEPVVGDSLTRGKRPRFLHPYPLNDKYFLVSAEVNPWSWDLYLVDIFDNITLIKESKEYALLEPVPFQKTRLPAIIPEKVDLSRKDAVVFITDIYEGPGLKGIPRGTVKNLRVYTYTFGFEKLAGVYGVIGMDGPWDMRRIIGTVPVEKDGSASFVVPANTPLAIQPLDAEGKALQIMRSWFTAMPGENLSCVGCHESPNYAPPIKNPIADKRDLYERLQNQNCNFER